MELAGPLLGAELHRTIRTEWLCPAPLAENVVHAPAVTRSASVRANMELATTANAANGVAQAKAKLANAQAPVNRTRQTATQAAVQPERASLRQRQEAAG